MAEKTILMTMVGMLVVTFVPRLLPAWFLRGKKLHPFLEAWLRYVPVAVLAALLLPSLLVQDGAVQWRWDNLYLWGAIPAGVVAWKKKSLFGTVIVGMLVVALARWLLF
jgi:branched-subunit amino acid transport protein